MDLLPSGRITVAMEQTSSSVVRPDVLKENRMSIHTFLRESYAIAKQQLQGNIDAFKDELRTFIALPINNFLKDITQIDQDFQKTPKIVSISEAVSTAIIMEENY